MAKTGPALERFWEPVFKLESGCWERRCSTQSSGYTHLMVDYKYIKAHRFSWELHKGPIPKGIDCLHKCDNRICVNPDHLFLGTHLDNMRDMIRKKRGVFIPPIGEKNGNRKLCNKDVLQMRRLFNLGVPIDRLIAMYPVSRQHLSVVIRGKQWKHIPL